MNRWIVQSMEIIGRSTRILAIIQIAIPFYHNIYDTTLNVAVYLQSPPSIYPTILFYQRGYIIKIRRFPTSMCAFDDVTKSEYRAIFILGIRVISAPLEVCLVVYTLDDITPERL